MTGAWGFWITHVSGSSGSFIVGSLASAMGRRSSDLSVSLDHRSVSRDDPGASHGERSADGAYRGGGPASASRRVAEDEPPRGRAPSALAKRSAGLFGVWSDRTFRRTARPWNRVFRVPPITDGESYRLRRTVRLGPDAVEAIRAPVVLASAQGFTPPKIGVLALMREDYRFAG
jgi:hypothetical protein